MLHHFAIAKGPTPILNSQEFKTIYKHEVLPLNQDGLLKHVETIALPETKFQLLEACSETICRVRTEDYPGENLFVDTRFLRPAEENTPERSKNLPRADTLLSRLKDLVGTPYVWGGNWSQGIEEMLAFYPPPGPLDPHTHIQWTLSGLDCSGLLYQVTGGYTPRNTSQLIHFGTPASMNALRELDLIVWPGHVVLVLDPQTAIESRAGFGVITTPLDVRLQEILTERRPFSIRRWHPELID
jgi:hypothetical protein